LGGTAPLPPIANAALQAARADLEARLAGLPLHQTLGGSTRPIRARHTFGLVEEPSVLVERVAAVVVAGISAVKLKIRPGWDIEHITEVRGAFRSLDLDAHAALRKRELLAVGLDEAIRSTGDARRILQAGAADLLSLKANRLGLEAATKIRDLASSEGVAVKVGGTFDTSIGRRLLLAFATLEGVTDAEIAPPSGYLVTDVADYPDLVAGTITPDDRPGIGIDPDHDRLADLEIRRTTIGG
jgi:O-succinylbenzoate synthase